MYRRFLTILVIISFISTLIIPPQKVYAQGVLGLPEAGVMVHLSPAYEPILIEGLRIDPANPLDLDFIVTTGNSLLTANDPRLKSESERLIKYFYAALTLPDKDVWVNLSPYEKDRIVPQATGETEMGRDMLAQDYMLKQITASLIYPENGLGKDFWNRIYKESYQRFGTTRVPVDTFNKVWIVADKVSVYEAKNTVMVTDAHLKVMLEEDYLSLQKHDNNISSSHSLASQIIRAIILPALEKEVNEGKNFANLRQIFHSLILAKWYKESLKNALLNQVYSNKNKISGVDVKDKAIKDRIYQQYLEAYKKGVFNYIKDDIDRSSKQALPRKYFSGGISAAMVVKKSSESQAMHSIQALTGVGNFLLVKSFAAFTNHWPNTDNALGHQENVSRPNAAMLMKGIDLAVKGFKKAREILYPNYPENQKQKIAERIQVVDEINSILDLLDSSNFEETGRKGSGLGRGLYKFGKRTIYTDPIIRSVLKVTNLAGRVEYKAIRINGEDCFVLSFLLLDKFSLPLNELRANITSKELAEKLLNLSLGSNIYAFIKLILSNSKRTRWTFLRRLYAPKQVSFVNAAMINLSDAQIRNILNNFSEIRARGPADPVNLVNDSILGRGLLVFPLIHTKYFPYDAGLIMRNIDLRGDDFRQAVQQESNGDIVHRSLYELRNRLEEIDGVPSVRQPYGYLIKNDYDNEEIFIIRFRGGKDTWFISMMTKDKTHLPLRFLKGGDIVNLHDLPPGDLQKGIAEAIRVGLIPELKSPKEIVEAREHFPNALLALSVGPGGLLDAVKAGADILITTVGVSSKEIIEARNSADPARRVYVFSGIDTTRPDAERRIDDAVRNDVNGVNFYPAGNGQDENIRWLLKYAQFYFKGNFTLVEGGVNAQNRSASLGKSRKAIIGASTVQEIKAIAIWARTAMNSRVLDSDEEELNGGEGGIQTRGGKIVLSNGKGLTPSEYLLDFLRQQPRNEYDQGFSKSSLEDLNEMLRKWVEEFPMPGTFSKHYPGIMAMIDGEMNTMPESGRSKSISALQAFLNLLEDQYANGFIHYGFKREKNIYSGINEWYAFTRAVLLRAGIPADKLFSDAAMINLPRSTLSVPNGEGYKERNLGRDGACQISLFELNELSTGAVGAKVDGVPGLRLIINFSKVKAGNKTESVELKIFLSNDQNGDQWRKSLWIDKDLNLLTQQPKDKPAIRLDFANKNDEIWLGALNNIGAPVFFLVPHRQVAAPVIQASLVSVAPGEKAIDAAMIRLNEPKRGGIDFDPSRFKIQRTGSAVEIKLNPAMIAQFRQGNFKGIQPMVTGITPIADIYPMVGLKEPNAPLAVD